MKQTAVEWLVTELFALKEPNSIEIQIIDQAKEMEKQQKGYSEEEVLPLLEMLEKCKEYFLLKTDAKSEERADAIGQAIKDYKQFKNK
jgi:cell division septum initiation protein DivIVA